MPSTAMVVGTPFRVSRLRSEPLGSSDRSLVLDQDSSPFTSLDTTLRRVFSKENRFLSLPPCQEKEDGLFQYTHAFLTFKSTGDSYPSQDRSHWTTLVCWELGGMGSLRTTILSYVKKSDNLRKNNKHRPTEVWLY